MTIDVPRVQAYSGATATVIYEWRCAGCGLRAERTFRVGPGDHLPVATMPDAWQFMAGRYYCPSHQVVTLVDGKVIDAG